MAKPIQLPLVIRDRRRRHWHWAPDIIVDLYGGLIGPHGLAVYYALSRYANWETETAKPALVTLSKVTGVSERQVRRELRKLQQFGLISVGQRAGTSSLYKLLEPPEDVGQFLVQSATSETPDRESAPPATESPRTDSPPELDIVVVDSSQKVQQQHQQHDSSLGDTQSALGLLVEFGVIPSIAERLVERVPAWMVHGWIDYASDPGVHLRNPQAFVVERLKRRDPPPKPRSEYEQTRQRYLGGEYANFIKH